MRYYCIASGLLLFLLVLPPGGRAAAWSVFADGSGDFPSLIQAIEKFHRFLGPEFTVAAPCLGNQRINLKQITNLLSERLVDLYRRNNDGVIPALRRDSRFQNDPLWRDLTLFYEYFHAENGRGLGAAHQTGWTGLLANMVMRRYEKDITPWSGLDAGRTAAWMDELA